MRSCGYHQTFTSQSLTIIRDIINAIEPKPIMTLSYPNVKTVWTESFKTHLAAPLFSPTDEKNNVRFICRDNEEFSWNGLAYLGSLSAIITPRSEEEQRFTVMLPDYAAPMVRKLILLISTGAVMIRSHESHFGHLR